jgi:hypothetical protein
MAYELERQNRRELAHEIWVAMRNAMEPVMPGVPMGGGWTVAGLYWPLEEAKESGV